MTQTVLDRPVIPAVLQDSRWDFPLLVSEPHLAYLDNAATSLKPRQVIDAIQKYYSRYSANVHRSFHTLGEEATREYELARQKIAKFIHARSEREIVFTSGATAALNLAAWSYGMQVLGPGDTVLLTEMEHHSNLVPWQMVAQRTGARLAFLPFDEKGQLILDDLYTLLSNQVKIVSLNHASNVFGTINPVKTIIDAAHARNIPVFIDAAQSVPHLPVDVQDLNCDLLAFSGHKMLGPTGIGVLYGRSEFLEKMEPWMGGGDMISAVWLDHSRWNDVPYRFEAGTPPIAQAIGLGAAVEYLGTLGMETISTYLHELTGYALSRLEEIEGLTVYGHAPHRTGALSFSLAGVHPHDIAEFVNTRGIAIRAGHHCAQPVMRHLGISAAARASLYFYNTSEEIDRLQAALQECREFFTK